MPAAPPEAEAGFAPLLAVRHVALAVSGGSDSIALMRLAADWARSNHPGLVLSVLTVDHRLRPEAAAEAAQVNGWAAALGLPHHTLSWDEQPKPATGIQAAARKARYDLMAGWCRDNDAGALLTAHTLDDQAETVLMRLARTISPDSLAGIRQQGSWNGLPLLRPLLGMRRQELRDRLAAMGQPWIEDPSNADPRFERVRVRQSLALAGTESVTPERLAALALKSARASELLERTAGRWIALWLREEDCGLCHVALSDFAGLPAALQERILGRIIARYGGGEASPEPAELRRAVAWALGGAGPVRRTLGGALLGRRKAGFWATREAARIRPGPMTVPEEGKALWDGRFLVEAPAGTLITASGDRKPALAVEVPAAARRAYPWIEAPEGVAEAPRIAFLRLNSG